MTSYRITSRAGVDLGTYEGETPEDAIRAMLEDAGTEYGSETGGTVDSYAVDPVDAETTTRVSIHVIEPGSGSDSRQDLRADAVYSGTEAECRAYLDESGIAYDHHYGVALVRDDDGAIDWGHGWESDTDGEQEQ